VGGIRDVEAWEPFRHCSIFQLVPLEGSNATSSSNSLVRKTIETGVWLQARK
jgi:hypothetical protein